MWDEDSVAPIPERPERPSCRENAHCSNALNTCAKALCTFQIDKSTQTQREGHLELRGQGGLGGGFA